jgi:hypothetical protein
MTRYHTECITIDAIQCTNQNLDEVKAFAGDAIVFEGDTHPRLRVGGGWLNYIYWGDWVAKTPTGFQVLLTRDIQEWFEEQTPEYVMREVPCAGCEAGQ